MTNPDLPPDSITTLPRELRTVAIRGRYGAMAYSGPTAADRERDTAIGHLLDQLEAADRQTAELAALREDVLAAALRLRNELDQAIAALLGQAPAPGLNAENWGVSILLNRFLQDHLEDPGAELVAQASEKITGKPFERMWPKDAKHTPFEVCDCRPGEKYHCAADWGSDGAPVPHRIALSVRVKPPERGGSFSITHPPACDRLAYGEQCAFQLAWWRTKPELPELGVYDAVVREGGIEFLRVRDLEAGDWHG